MPGLDELEARKPCGCANRQRSGVRQTPPPFHNRTCAGKNGRKDRKTERGLHGRAAERAADCVRAAEHERMC